MGAREGGAGGWGGGGLGGRGGGLGGLGGRGGGEGGEGFAGDPGACACSHFCASAPVHRAQKISLAAVTSMHSDAFCLDTIAPPSSHERSEPMFGLPCHAPRMPLTQPDRLAARPSVAGAPPKLLSQPLRIGACTEV